VSADAAGGPPSGEPARPVDVARAALARAREDARARDVGRRGQWVPGGRARPGARTAGRPQRDGGEPVALADALERLLADRDWQRPAAAARLLAAWDTVVGPEVAARCRPAGLRDGELSVVAESSAWATQLRLLSRALLARIHAEVGTDLVSGLRITGPTGRTSRPQTPGARPCG
jgi:predicted nucleic acid-binding Zn ribbon protein